MSETIIPPNCLWQYLEKEHLDPENEMSQELWNEFVNEWNDTFADSTSTLGREYLGDFLQEKKEEKEVTP